MTPGTSSRTEAAQHTEDASMAYLVSESRLEEESIIEIEAEAVVQRIFNDGVGLYELMETLDRESRDNLDNLLVRFIQADGDRKIFSALQQAAEACVRGK